MFTGKCMKFEMEGKHEIEWNEVWSEMICGEKEIFSILRQWIEHPAFLEKGANSENQCSCCTH